MSTKRRSRHPSQEVPTLGDYICPADEYVERLYQEQAKLVANPPEFLCRPTDCGLEPSSVDEHAYHLHNEVESNNDLFKTKLKKLDPKESKPKKITRVSEPFFPPAMDDLLCQPRCYSFDSADASSRHSISYLDETMNTLESSYLNNSLVEEESADKMSAATAVAHGKIEGARVEQGDRTSKTNTPLRKSLKSQTTTPVVSKNNTTPPKGIPSYTYDTPNRQSVEITTPSLDTIHHKKHNSPTNNKDAAKWSPTKAKQPNNSTTTNTFPRESPLRTKLEQKFKSSPLKENADKNNTSHDLSSSSSSTPSRGSHKLSPLKIKLEEKFKSSPLKTTSRRAPQDATAVGQEHEVKLPNEHIEVEKSQGSIPSLGDLLCGPVNQANDQAKNDSTLATADDSLVEHSFVASAGETSLVLETTVDEFAIDPLAHSILETTDPSINMQGILADAAVEQSYMEEGIEQEWSQDGIERELSLSLILPNETDIHNVDEPEGPLWELEEPEWNLQDESFMEDAVSPLVQDVSQENGSDENPQDVVNEESKPQKYHYGAVLRTMNSFPDRKIYQLHGLKVLKKTTDKNPSAIGAKAVPIILASMKRYPLERMHQWRGLMTLVNLVDRKVNAESLVLKHNGMKVVINTLSEYSADVGIVLAVCALITKLGEFESLQKPIADAKTVKHLADVFHEHEGDQVVYQAARDTMKLLL